jgi:hypothetical protein
MGIFLNPPPESNGGGREPAAERSGYDRVIVTAQDGRITTYSRSEFESLPLTERVKPLLEGRTKFFRAGFEVSPRQALIGA